MNQITDCGKKYQQFRIEIVRARDNNPVMPSSPVSFAQDIAPLFSQGDVSCMSHFGVHLKDPAYMSDETGSDQFPDHANARNVYARLTGDAKPQMPMGGPYWSDDQLQLFNQWMTDGFQA